MGTSRAASLLLASSMCILFLSECSYRPTGAATDYVSKVDPLIGSGGHGHVFVGASVPHGMVQLGPNNRNTGWDWCSGYHDGDSTLAGFAHTHLSGTGIADLGDVLFLPTTLEDAINSDMHFVKSTEHVEPGYYAVTTGDGIEAELTASDRVGFHRYIYPKGADARLLIDLHSGVKSIMGRQGTTGSTLDIIDSVTVAGSRTSDEWARDHCVYFAAKFSRPIKSYSINNDSTGIRATLDFGPAEEPLEVITGISYVDIDGAATNLAAEGSAKTFDETRKAASSRWNEELSRIDFKSDDPDVEKIFYTALYHTMIAPQLFVDADGRYQGADGEIHDAAGFTPHTVFSLWDTYRAVNPLYTLIDPNTPDYINSLIDISRRQKGLPMWHLVGHETECMVGLHSVPVIVDACLKGIPGIDPKEAWQEVARLDSMDTPGLAVMRDRGYIPADEVPWSVAWGLEYAIDEYAAARLAERLGLEDEHHKHAGRAGYYKEYFDPAIGFMRGKLADGSRRKGFDPSHSIHMEDDYVEGNGWQYTWLVPHDPQGLIELFGGCKPFVAKLDSLFTASSELNEGASADITGMIGQYAHGNEPGHHIIYLYNYAGEPEKGADRLRQVYDEFYTTEADGLIGNEDCGQMSAWYIFSTLGFYPVNPVSGEFAIGLPLAREATINLSNGNIFKINVNGNGKHVKEVKLNGKDHDPLFITYDEIMAGGVMEFTMHE